MNFSIVICNYNYGRFLGTAIESCLLQDYPADRVEVIVVDDGSSDESCEVLARYADRSGVRILGQPNRGQGAALAAGVAEAAGDYICLLDSDDFFDPAKLRRLREHIVSIQPADELFLCHDVRLYDDAAGGPIDQTWFEAINLANAPAEMTLEQCDHQFPFAIPCGQVFSRRLAQRVFDALPGADWRYAADSPIAHTAFLETGVVHYVHQTLAYYRIHGANDLAGLENGRYRPRSDWKSRVPSMIAHLERFLHTLADDGAERSSRIAYLKSKERGIRVGSPLRRQVTPQLGFIVDARERPEALARTLSTIASQTYPDTKVVILGNPDTPSLREVDLSRIDVLDKPSGAHTEALTRLDSSFVCLVDAGTDLAPTFASRQLEAHQYAGLVNVVYCNGRPATATTASVLALLGQHSEQLKAFATEPRRLALPTFNAAVLRHSDLLGKLIATAESIPHPICWKQLLGALLHAMSGSVFIAEHLVSAQPQDIGDLLFPYPPLDPQEVCTLWWMYCTHHQFLQQWTSAGWHSQFVGWVSRGAGAADVQRMRDLARSTGAREALAMLEEVAPAHA